MENAGAKKCPAITEGSGAGLTEQIDINIPFDKKNVKQKSKGVYIFDPRQFQGAYYWERGFLSCVIAGAEIPDTIKLEHFRMPFNRVIFQALRVIKCGPGHGLFVKYNLLVSLLKATGNFEKAGGETYLVEIRDMIGVPSAAYAFAVKLVELKAGVKV